jgi:hypothetical protein
MICLSFVMMTKIFCSIVVVFKAGTNLPAGIGPLFQSELNGASFEYFFDVSKYPNGSKFDVTLWMAEIFFENAGERVFSVFAESKSSSEVLKDLDLIKDIGAKNVAKKYTFQVTVNDGQLNIFFIATKDKAKVSGIQVLVDSSPPVAPPVTSPVAPPAVSPVASPVLPPAAPPVATPKASPVAPPVAPPVALPVSPPVATPKASPVAPPVAPPVTPPVSPPVATQAE